MRTMQGSNGKHLSAREKVDQMIKGKPKDQQIAILKHYISESKNRYAKELDVYVEAVNRKVALETNGISKKIEKHKPESEGLMNEKGGLVAAMALSGMGGC